MRAQNGPGIDLEAMRDLEIRIMWYKRNTMGRRAMIYMIGDSYASILSSQGLFISATGCIAVRSAPTPAALRIGLCGLQ